MYIYALLEKDDVISGMSVYGVDRFQVANYCGRSKSAYYSDVISTAADAYRIFNDAVATSVERGWRVIYYGPPKFG